GEGLEVPGRQAALLEGPPGAIGAIRVRVERADKPGDAVARPGHRELQLFQISRRLQPAYEERVPHHLTFETGEILALRRPARAVMLRESGLACERSLW